ncbi:MAG TPA: nucleotidyltransferase family protein [Caulobacteraceae bacterium]|nr:nucleotidyltransferase family protein [Caulobacteraceae bacterium]
MTTEGGPFEAIVLAAGAGRRFGGAKLTSTWRGGRLIDGALGAALSAPVARVLVVTGADPDVATAARAFGQARGGAKPLAVVHAADHDLGLSASLRAGFAAIDARSRGAFLFLGDMPLVPHDIAAKLADVLKGDVLAAAPGCQGRRGHPALFARALFGSIAELRGDQGARRILDRLGERLALVDTTDTGVLVDIDAPGDLIRLQ